MGFSFMKATIEMYERDFRTWGPFRMFGGMHMEYAFPISGGCYCPVHPLVCYGSDVAKVREERMVLELIGKEKNGFGDTIYYIRDGKGATSMVAECNLSDYMKKNGVTELKEGLPFQYPVRLK